MSKRRSCSRPACHHPGGSWPALTTLALALAQALSAHANPTGAQAVAGSVQLQSSGSHLQVTTQNAPGTQHSVINWQTFSVPAGSSTYFQQPSAASTSINRVVTANPSQIHGQLGSNGRLIVVNPAGITVGAGAVVDTAGFVASTLHMSDADALAARLRFGDGTPGGTLTVDGHIVSRQGDLVLIASRIETGASALLQAPQGQVTLAAGGRLELTGRGLEGIRFEVQAPEHTVRQLGRIEGDAVGVFAGTLRHSGIIESHAVTTEGGRVVLRASGDAYVQDQARIAASRAGGTLGGQVDVLGDRVAVRDQAQIDASGAQGGGQIRIGGDYLGGNADVPNARYTYFGPQARLKADATQSGNGGRVIVWADEQTQAYGHISARGGQTGGDGGFVETSGKRRLDIGQAVVDTRAPMGRTGTWLLDPDNITVDALGLAPLITVDEFADVGGTLVVAPLLIGASLSNVVLQANEDINIDAPITMLNAGVGFTAQAGGFLNVNGGITTQGGAVTLVSGDPGSLTSPTEGSLNLNASIDTTGGGAAPAGAAVSLVANLSDVGGNSVVLNGNINAGTGGTISLTGQEVDQFGGILTTSNLVVSTDNGISLTANNQIDAAQLTVGASGNNDIQLRSTRDLTLNGVSNLGNGDISINTVAAAFIEIGGDVESAAGSVSLVASGQIRNGGGHVLAAAGQAISLTGSALGATGSGNYLQVGDGGGPVLLTATSGGIFVQQHAGPMVTSDYTISAVGANQEIKLAAAGTFGATLNIDGFGGFNPNTTDDDIGFFNVASSGSIQLSAGLSRTARSVDIGAEGTATLTVANGAATTFNAVNGVSLSTQAGALNLLGTVENTAAGGSAGIDVTSVSGNIVGSGGGLRTTGGGDVTVEADSGAITGSLSIQTTASSAGQASGDISVSTLVTGAISLGTLITDGASGAGAGEAGADAGDISIVAGGASVALASASARGGTGAAGSGVGGGDAGDGGDVLIRRSAAGNLSVSNLSVDTSGGNGGAAVLAGFNAGDGGDAGRVDVYAQDGVVSLTGTAATVTANGGIGGNASLAVGNGGDGGNGGDVVFGRDGVTGNAGGVLLATGVTVNVEDGAAGTGATPGVVGVNGMLQFSSGTGGVSQSAGSLTVTPDADVAIQAGTGSVNLGTSANAIGKVRGTAGGAVTIAGLTGVAGAGLSAAGNIVLSRLAGGMASTGGISSTGAAGSVTISASGTLQFDGAASVQAGTGGVSLSSTGDGVVLTAVTVSTPGNVTIVGSGNEVGILDSTVESTGGNVSIAGTPFSAGLSAVVISGQTAPTRVAAASQLQISGGPVVIGENASGSYADVEAPVVTISTSGGTLALNGGLAPNAHAALLATTQMDLNLGGNDLIVTGGSGTDAYALVGSASGSASVSVDSGFVSLIGGSGSGSYAGLINVGGDITTPATLNLTPNLSGAGVLLAAHNYASLTTNPVGATPVLYSALTVDTGTGVVSDGGSALSVLGIVVGTAASPPPPPPVSGGGGGEGSGTSDLTQIFLALLQQDLAALLSVDEEDPASRRRADALVSEAEICTPSGN